MTDHNLLNEERELRTRAHEGLALRLERHVLRPNMSRAQRELAAAPYYALNVSF